MAQCLAQAVLLLTELILLGFLSLLTGSENKQSPASSACVAVADAQQQTPLDCDIGVDNCGPMRVINNGPPTPSLSASYQSEHGYYSSNNNNSFNQLDDTSPLLLTAHAKPTLSRERTRRGCLGFVCVFWERWSQRVFLCLMTFLGLCTNYSYFIYVSNYVGQVIYQGDPNAESGSPGYGSYLDGVHMASLGMLTFYLLFILFNVCHSRILALIGMRREYMLASVLCTTLMLTLVMTDSLVTYFFVSACMAMFRTAVYTTPFILSNRLAIREKKERSIDGRDIKAFSGIAMATVTTMIPASYGTVSLVMGPLLMATGDLRLPVYFATCTCVMGLGASAFVSFE